MAAAVTIAVRVLVPVLLLAPAPAAAAVEFTFTGFARENLTTSGAAVTSAGLLQLTNATNWVSGHGFYPAPLRFKDAATGAPLSFSTTFIAAILPRYPDAHGHGLAFALAPSANGPARAVAGKYLGLFNVSDNNVGSNGTTTSVVVAVELDTALDAEFDDIDDNHVGVDVHGLRSVASKSAGSVGVALASGKLLQVWIEYDAASTRLEVTVSAAAVGVPRPSVPLVSCSVNLSSEVADQTYVGFSAANGAASSSHYVLGWSFHLGGGRAPDLDLSKLPRLPPPSGQHKKAMELTVLLSLILLAIVVLLVASAAVTVLVVWRRRRFTEEQEDWELEYGPHRISYKDLHAATRGFRDVIGGGGFGVVYRGVLPPRPGGVDVAIKKVSHDSRQGLREFVSEIASMSRLRHRNLVQLLGYCRRRGELLLVYDYMVNGSLDKHLFGAGDDPPLSWEQRAKIVRGVAAGLLYLHEGWEQVVVHRDIKSANVLLDADMNGKLSDFGLARLYDHGSDSRTTHVIGTLGYLAPEMVKTGKATPSADVFAFGAFLLEVACGRRPMESLGNNGDPAGLVDSVLERWKAGRIKDAWDPRIGKCDEDDLELVLKLGLLCSHPDPRRRPSMRQVVQILEGAVPVPDTPPEDLGGAGGRVSGYYETFDEFVNVFPTTTFDITAITPPQPCSPSSAEHQQLISG